MNSKAEMLGNYKPDTIYLNPLKDGSAYVTFAQDVDVTIQISPKVKFVIQAFYAKSKQDLSSFNFIKLKLTQGKWIEDERVSLSSFNFYKLREFLHIINGIDFRNVEKARLSLHKDLDISSLLSILQTEKGREVLKQLTNQPIFLDDLYALAHKKEQLDIFHKLLFEYEIYKDQYITDNKIKATGEENIWQHFFEQNEWIFGHGLRYQFLHKVDDKKLEIKTAARSYGSSSGHRVDGFMQTQALVSQFVFIEIKTPSSHLLKNKGVRDGCWAISTDVTDAISQIQKAVFDFVKNKPEKIERKEDDGRSTGDFVYNVAPKSILIIGKLSELVKYDEKITSFLLFRDSLKSPEIITYDELYERARCIVDTISHK